MACVHVFKGIEYGKVCIFDDCKKKLYCPMTEQDRERLETFMQAVHAPKVCTDREAKWLQPLLEGF